MSTAETHLDTLGVTLSLVENETPRVDEGVLLETKKFRGMAEIGRAVVPFTLEYPADPDQIADSTPALLLNGYGAKEFGYHKPREASAQRAKPTISMRPYGFLKWYDQLDPSLIRHPEATRSKAAWGVIRCLQDNANSLEGVDVNQVDAVGHSWGLDIAVQLALRKPGTVRNIVNAEGVGCEETHNLMRMMPRVLPFGRKEMIPAIRRRELDFEGGVVHALLSELDYFFPHLPKAMAEGYRAGTADVRGALKYLKRTQNLGLAAIVGAKDNLIPADKTIAASWGSFDYGVVVDGDHLLPINQPELFADEMIKAINYLNSLKKIVSVA
jgi:pimeloyl-ACP methyl ester carboxylesterase